MSKHTRSDKERRAMFANMGQTKRGMSLDRNITAKRSYPLTKENVTRWKKHPNQMDIKGLDTKIKTKNKITKTEVKELDEQRDFEKQMKNLHDEKKIEERYVVRHKHNKYFVIDKKTGYSKEFDDIQDAMSHYYKQKGEYNIYNPKPTTINPNAKSMKKPTYSKFEWNENRGLLVNDNHTVAKGTEKQMKEWGATIYQRCNEQKDVSITVKNESLPPKDDDIIKIGTNYYSPALVYKIQEEISGEKIITKDESKPIKKAIGKTFILHTRQDNSDNSKYSLEPVLIEGNDGLYALAPLSHEDF